MPSAGVEAELEATAVRQWEDEEELASGDDAQWEAGWHLDEAKHQLDEADLLVAVISMCGEKLEKAEANASDRNNNCEHAVCMCAYKHS